MKNYIYLVHSEVSEDTFFDVESKETSTLAFSAEEKAAKYIDDEYELFIAENKERNCFVSKDTGYFGAVYPDGHKMKTVKMWYERVLIAE